MMYYILVPCIMLFINYYLFLEETSADCLNFVTQPELDENSGQWTGKFSPNNSLFFPKNETSNQLKRILFKFDVIDDIDIGGYRQHF
jgi:hypothetical protein